MTLRCYVEATEFVIFIPETVIVNLDPTTEEKMTV